MTSLTSTPLHFAVIVTASRRRRNSKPNRSVLRSRISSFMAKEQHLRPWFLDLVPALVVFLAAAHVIALVLLPVILLFFLFLFEYVLISNGWSLGARRVTGFTDWPLIVELRVREANFTEETSNRFVIWITVVLKFQQLVDLLPIWYLRLVGVLWSLVLSLMRRISEMFTYFWDHICSLVLFSPMF